MGQKEREREMAEMNRQETDFPGELTRIVLIKRVHAGEIDGQGLEGGRQADAALRALHVEPWSGRRLRRLGQPRLGILHAEHGTRRLDRLSQHHTTEK